MYSNAYHNKTTINSPVSSPAVVLMATTGIPLIRAAPQRFICSIISVMFNAITHSRLSCLPCSWLLCICSLVLPHGGLNVLSSWQVRKQKQGTCWRHAAGPTKTRESSRSLKEDSDTEWCDRRDGLTCPHVLCWKSQPKTIQKNTCGCGSWRVSYLKALTIHPNDGC